MILIDQPISREIFQSIFGRYIYTHGRADGWGDGFGQVEHCECVNFVEFWFELKKYKKRLPDDRTSRLTFDKGVRGQDTRGHVAGGRNSRRDKTLGEKLRTSKRCGKTDVSARPPKPVITRRDPSKMAAAVPHARAAMKLETRGRPKKLVRRGDGRVRSDGGDRWTGTAAFYLPKIGDRGRCSDDGDYDDDDDDSEKE